MGLFEGRAQLGKLMKDLRTRWQETRMNWDDENARQFEERFIVPLEHDLRTAVSAMDEMAVLITQVKSECQ